jgi:hypothetical protein
MSDTQPPEQQPTNPDGSPILPPDSTDIPPESSATETPPETPPADVGQEQVQAKVDAENETGVVGTKVDPLPDSAFTAPGSDSPPAAAQPQE